MTTASISTREAVLRYVVFAAIATAANIAAQELAINVAPIAPLEFSILTGTIVGFVLKYVLDKYYVFSDAFDGAAQEARKVMLYGAFSVVTTLIFWGFELFAWSIWQTSFAKYLGAILGLAIGYALKFALDRRFVFGGRML